MRKMTLFAMAALSVLLAGGALAQKPGTMTPGVKPHPMSMGSKTLSYTGTVKGAPAGGSFTLAMSSKSVMVMMAKGARARNKATGQFIGLTNIKPGSNVTVVGTMSGTMFTAKTVTVNSMPGAMKMMPKMGKMKK